MGELSTYSIISGDILIASGMSLETAVIFVKALMQEYFADEEIEYTIRREGKRTKNVAVSYSSRICYGNPDQCDDGK